ncbi:hypothetical protein FKP32DRAFT_140624 [Trametes sanguinea]|nr:hypothetical protein FKP32DRAFT_140624 [Trametes sanguinea]
MGLTPRELVDHTKVALLMLLRFLSADRIRAALEFDGGNSSWIDDRRRPLVSSNDAANLAVLRPRLGTCYQTSAARQSEEVRRSARTCDPQARTPTRWVLYPVTERACIRIHSWVARPRSLGRRLIFLGQGP